VYGKRRSVPTFWKFFGSDEWAGQGIRLAMRSTDLEGSGAIAPMPQISGESHYFSGLTWFESARQILWSVEK
jgi:hypothetical protein